MSKTVALIVIGILSIASIGTVVSSSGWGERDDDERYEHEHESDGRSYESPRGGWFGSRADVSPVENDTYSSECGACHFAYQPGLLPRHAWERVMDSLEDHYDDDASLSNVQSAEIRSYLLTNAADRASQSRSRAFAAGPDIGSALPRITETPYFRREHYEIPPRLVTGNTDVGSFSNCQRCHRNAKAGIYNEHQVVIPNFGRWDN